MSKKGLINISMTSFFCRLGARLSGGGLLLDSGAEAVEQVTWGVPRGGQHCSTTLLLTDRFYLGCVKEG